MTCWGNLGEPVVAGEARAQAERRGEGSKTPKGEWRDMLEGMCGDTIKLRSDKIKIHPPPACRDGLNFAHVI
jgi:hypothetical protein